MNIFKVVTSNDNTRKYYFKVTYSENVHIEACLLNLQRYGYIICVSSQIGCSQKCKFCAAGNGRFVRNLTSEEIQEQVRLIVEDNPQLIKSGFQVTYMGSGEPLNNYINVFDSIDCIRKKYTNLSKVNLSTTGPIVGKQCFESIDWRNYRDFLHFQYSLHFTQDTERNRFFCTKLMTISETIECLNHISDLINDTYKINYIPFDSLNDKEEHIEELKKLMGSTQNAVLKISRMCEINECELLPSEAFEKFSTVAKKTIEKVEIFSSDGTDISAGCGQFYNESVV